MGSRRTTAVTFESVILAKKPEGRGSVITNNQCDSVTGSGYELTDNVVWDIGIV
jgi:hypothetical protein